MLQVRGLLSEARMADIFLSYASEDLPRIRELVDAFDASGLTVFWDRTIPPGKTWRKIIGAELQQASAVLVCWSAQSIESQWVLEETEVGKERGILLPVLFEKVGPPLGFASIQAANLLPDSPARSQELDAWCVRPWHSSGRRTQPRLTRRQLLRFVRRALPGATMPSL